MYHTHPLRVDYLISWTCLSHEIPRALASHTDNFSHPAQRRNQDLWWQASPRVFVLILSLGFFPILHDTPNPVQRVRDQNSQ